MPTENRIGLNNDQRSPPVRKPPTGQDPKSSISISQLRARMLALQDHQLLPKAQVLRYQISLGLEESRNRSN
jgi:hypothetical protein